MNYEYVEVKQLEFFFHLLLLHHQTARFYCVQRLHLFVVLKKCNVDSIQLITSIFSRQSFNFERYRVVWLLRYNVDV